MRNNIARGFCAFFAAALLTGCSSHGGSSGVSIADFGGSGGVNYSGTSAELPAESTDSPESVPESPATTSARTPDSPAESTAQTTPEESAPEQQTSASTQKSTPGGIRRRDFPDGEAADYCQCHYQHLRDLTSGGIHPGDYRDDGPCAGYPGVRLRQQQLPGGELLRGQGYLDKLHRACGDNAGSVEGGLPQEYCGGVR